MISGLNYNKICKWHVCPRYEQKFDVNSVEENDLVFLNLDYFEQFMNFITNNNPRNRFVLVTQNSDRNFSQEMYNAIDKFVNKIYAINATCIGEKLIKVPLGFNDTAINYISNIEQQSEKNNLIYCNFKICHHPERKECFDYFGKFDWVDIYPEGMHNIKQMPFTDFYNILKTYKYCISPRGAGIDTHRTYESIYFGVIPIVKRNELSDLYKELPILLVDDWKEITKEFLEENYNKLYSNLTEWVDKNKNWYITDYWIKNG
jgi:hypothetical protein